MSPPTKTAKKKPKTPEAADADAPAESKATERKPLLVILDSHGIIFRSFYALRDILTVRRTGEPVAAVFGYANSLLTVFNELEPTHVIAAWDASSETFRKELDERAKKEGYRVTLLAFLIKASVAALKQHWELNSSIAPSGDALIRKHYYNIGFAADTPNGLVVPVIKDADKKGVIDLSKELGELSEKARDGKLSPAEMSGASFTISSLGGIGGVAFTPIVNAPEVAILGVSRSKMAPVWDGKQFVPRNMLPLSLSYDHRAIDGALAARFNATLKTLLGDVRRLLL